MLCKYMYSFINRLYKILGTGIPGRCRAHALLLTLLLAALSACTSQEVVKANAVPVNGSAEEARENQLLNVGIVIFDPGIPESPEELKKANIFPAVRQAESRCIPFTLKEVLEQTGQWGYVWLMPDADRPVDLLMFGTILVSDGAEVSLDITVQDATGAIWLTGQYTDRASKYAYTDEHFQKYDPFQSLYHTIANDLSVVRERHTQEAIDRIRTTAQLRFASDFLPGLLDGYLSQTVKGRYVVNRLPSKDDPMFDRLRKIEGRDAMLMDTLNGHYGTFCNAIKSDYRIWRKANFEETIALEKLQRSARNRMVMGGAAVVAGVAGGMQSSSTAGQAVSTATAIGGAGVFASGVEKHAQSKIHAEALQELSESFNTSVEPQVVDIDNRTVTLTGSAETQYQEWRRLLNQIHLQETGLPPE